MALSARLEGPGEPILELTEGQRAAVGRIRARLRDGTYRLEPTACFCGDTGGREIAGRDAYGLPFRTVLCERCGLLRTSPDLSPESRARFFAEDHPALSRADSDAARNANVERGRALHRELSGIGLPMAMVAELGAAPTGTLTAFRESGARIVVGDAPVVPPDRVELLLVVGTLNQRTSLRAALAEAIERVRPGGFVYVRVPGIARIEEEHRHDVLGLLRAGESFYFCAGTLTYVLEASGLEVLRVDEECTAIARRRPEAAPNAEQAPRILHFLKQNEAAFGTSSDSSVDAPVATPIASAADARVTTRSEEKEPSFYFCIGSPKTGSTILSRLLDQHPRIACMSESYAFEPMNASSVMNPASEKWRIHGFTKEQVQGWARTWAAQRGDRREILVRGFRATMTEALEDFRRRLGAESVGDRWPFYFRYIDLLVEAFPNAKFVYNVRDPRAVWNSGDTFKGRGKGDLWLAATLEAEKTIAPYLDRPSFLTVRYEDMIRDPEPSMKRIYEFLGFDFRPEYLAYDPASDPYPARWDWVPEAKRPLEPAQTEKWRDRMAREQVEKVTRVANEFLARYGYAA